MFTLAASPLERTPNVVPCVGRAPSAESNTAAVFDEACGTYAAPVTTAGSLLTAEATCPAVACGVGAATAGGATRIIPRTATTTATLVRPESLFPAPSGRRRGRRPARVPDHRLGAGDRHGPVPGHEHRRNVPGLQGPVPRRAGDRHRDGLPARPRDRHRRVRIRQRGVLAAHVLHPYAVAAPQPVPILGLTERPQRHGLRAEGDGVAGGERPAAAALAGQARVPGPYLSALVLLDVGREHVQVEVGRPRRPRERDDHRAPVRRVLLLAATGPTAPIATRATLVGRLCDVHGRLRRRARRRFGGVPLLLLLVLVIVLNDLGPHVDLAVRVVRLVDAQVEQDESVL